MLGLTIKDSVLKHLADEKSFLSTRYFFEHRPKSTFAANLPK
jgi:hypothetical protein